MGSLAKSSMLGDGLHYWQHSVGMYAVLCKRCYSATTNRQTFSDEGLFKCFAKPVRVSTHVICSDKCVRERNCNLFTLLFVMRYVLPICLWLCFVNLLMVFTHRSFITIISHHKLDKLPYHTLGNLPRRYWIVSRRTCGSRPACTHSFQK